MSMLKFPSIGLGKLFRRQKFDPTHFETINEEWDETSSSSADKRSNVSATGRFQNKVPLAQQIEQVNQKLALFKSSLPNLKSDKNHSDDNGQIST